MTDRYEIDMTDRYDITRIGTIEHGIDGSDEYLLVRDREQELDEQHLADLLDRRYYRRSSHPGGYFCTTQRIIHDPIHDDRCIVIVQHRYDV